MSVLTKRKGQPIGSTATAKVRKQSAPAGDIVFSDREMEHVLDKLPDGTLLRVVKDNSRLLPIACRFIQPRYLDKSFVISNKMEPQSVEFLKLFGIATKSLRLVYDGDYHRFDPEIEKLIFDCCLTGLYVICLVNANRLSMFNIAKPFENVTTLNLETGTLCTAFSRVGKWFPKLKTLNLIDIQLPCTTAAKFFSPELCPELQYLQIRNLKSTDDGNAYMKEIAVLVKNSPKLGTILIDCQDNIDQLLKTIADMSSNLPNLRLELNSDGRKPVGASDIHFKSLKSLNFLGFDNTFKISTDQIEQISVDCKCFDENWLTLFKNNKNKAHSIDVFAGKWMNDKVASKFVNLVKVIPSLRKMNMWSKLSTSLVVDLISNSRSFQHGKFVLSDKQNIKSMRDSLQPDWTCKCFSGKLYHIEKSNKRAKLNLSSTSEDSGSEVSTSEDSSSEL